MYKLEENPYCRVDSIRKINCKTKIIFHLMNDTNAIANFPN